MRPEERQELIAQAAALQRSGWGVREIAERLGVTKSTVSRWLHRAAVDDPSAVDTARLRKPIGEVHGVMNHDNFRTLYRFFDAEGRLLYVGQTTNVPAQRFGLHANEKAWWLSVATITLEHIDGTRSDLDRAERRAHATENPIFNQIRPPSPDDGEPDFVFLDEEMI